MSRLSRFLGFGAVSMGLRLPETRIDRFVELAHLKDLLEALCVNCVLDVGANCGQFARDLRGIGYVGRIISFEPVQREFAALTTTFAGDPLWSGHQVALGAEEKMTEIGVCDMTVMSSMLDSLDPDSQVKMQEVRLRRLDEMLPTLISSIDSPRVFLKMDTQGFDLEVFKGAQGCMSDIVGLQSELSVIPLYDKMPHYLEALATYEDSGFELYNLSVVNRVPTGDILELNCFMKRP
ncbi:MAG TPA: FkbM family methyltransferase [Tepidiformaceae bacterium]